MAAGDWRRRCAAASRRIPSRRFQSAHELALALEAISHDGTRPAASSQPVPGRRWRCCRSSNLSARRRDDQYFSDGLAEDLVNALARLPGLARRLAHLVVPLSAAASSTCGRSGASSASVPCSRAACGASGTQLRLTVHLTGVDDGYHIWSERYDRELADVFEVQDEVVKAIVAAIAPALVGGERQRCARATANPHAYDLYLKGRHLWNQRSPSVVGAAIACFEGAIALDDRFAAAYAGLADCYSILRVYGWMPPAQAQPKALEAVTRALALDPQLPAAHRAKGIYTFHFEPHWRPPRRRSRRRWPSTRTTPSATPPTACSWPPPIADDDARVRLTRALDRDPFSAQVHFLVASAACAMCDAEAASRHAARASSCSPTRSARTGRSRWRCR